MRCFALAVIFATLVVHGQEPKAHRSADKTDAAAESKNATDATGGQTVIVVNQQTPQRQENDRSGKPPSYLHELLLPANVPNLMLVVVGIAGIVAAVCTLKVIKRQTDATVDAAKAALLNAKALINAERPWVVIFYDGWKDGTFGFSAANKGRTPANIISFAVGFKCLSNVKQLPPEPEYGPEIFPTTNLLMPGESEWGTELVLMSRDECQSKMERCRDLRDTTVQFPQSGEKLPVFYFRVKYSIVIADKDNIVFGETRACYSVSPYDTGVSHCGGEAYNHYE